MLLLLAQWTALLAVGWILHAFLRRRHARWRLMIWRSLLVSAGILPLIPALPIPLFHLRLLPALASEKSSVGLGAPPAADRAAGSSDFLNPGLPAGEAARDLPATASPLVARVLAQAAQAKRILLLIWALGFAGAGLRLLRLHRCLARLRAAAGLAPGRLQTCVREIGRELGLSQAPEIRVSDSAVSPFVCSLSQPTIILPAALARILPDDELAALLAHELAHLRQHDLIWCLGWRWMKAVCWFHPLVWRIPSAHVLACEQDADQAAAAYFGDRGDYSQTLAQLSLRVLALPAVETSFTLNGASQIARRLHHLQEGDIGEWDRRDSVAGLCLGGALLLLVGAWQVSPALGPGMSRPTLPLAGLRITAAANSRTEEGRSDSIASGTASVIPVARRVGAGVTLAAAPKAQATGRVGANLGTPERAAPPYAPKQLPAPKPVGISDRPSGLPSEASSAPRWEGPAGIRPLTPSLLGGDPRREDGAAVRSSASALQPRRAEEPKAAVQFEGALWKPALAKLQLKWQLGDEEVQRIKLLLVEEMRQLRAVALDGSLSAPEKQGKMREVKEASRTMILAIVQDPARIWRLTPPEFNGNTPFRGVASDRSGAAQIKL